MSRSTTLKFFSLVFLVGCVHANPITVRWENPTENVDGSQVTGLDYATILYGPSDGDFRATRQVSPTGEHTWDPGECGTVAIRMTVTDLDGDTSGASNLLELPTGGTGWQVACNTAPIPPPVLPDLPAPATLAADYIYQTNEGADMSVVPTPVAQWDVNTRGRSDDAPYDHVNSQLESNHGTVTVRQNEGDGTEGLVYNGSTSNYSSLTFPSGLSASFPTGDFTMAVRMEIDNGVTGIGGAFAFGSSTNASEHLALGHEMGDERRLAWRDGDNNTSNLSETTDVSGQVGVLTVRRASGTSYLYWNGTQIDTDTTLTDMDSHTLDIARWGVVEHSGASRVWPFEGAVYWSAVWDEDIGTTAIGLLHETVNPFIDPDVEIVQAISQAGVSGTVITIDGTDGWATPAAGNLLVAVVSIRKGSGDDRIAISGSSGWTAEQTEYNASGATGKGAGGMYWKEAAGTESTTTFTLPVSQVNFTVTMLEIDATNLDLSSGPEASGEDTTNIWGSSGGSGSGNISNTTADSLAIAIFAGKITSTFDAYNSVNNGYQIRTSAGTGGDAMVAIATKRTTATGNQQCTWSSTDSGGNNYAASMIFPMVATNSTLDAGSGSFTLSGTAADLLASRHIDGASGSFTLTGTDVDLSVGRVLDAESGTFTLNGTKVDLTRALVLNAESGSFALSGTDATIGKSVVLDAESGSFTLAGTDADLTVSRVLQAESGTFTLSGTDANFQSGIALDAESGTFTLSGTDASLLLGRVLAAESGSVDLVGADVLLLRGLVMVAESGSFGLTGADVDLQSDRALVAQSGSFVVGSNDVTLTKQCRVDAESGTFVLSGTNAVLSWSGDLPIGGKPGIAKTGTRSIVGARTTRGLSKP